MRKGREFHGGRTEWAREPEREEKRGRTVTGEAAGGFGEKGSGEASHEGGAALRRADQSEEDAASGMEAVGDGERPLT